MSKTPRQPRNPLEPVSTVVGVITALVAAFGVLSLFLPSQGWGNGPVCTSAPYSSIPTAATQDYHAAVSGLAPGSHAAIQNVTLCADHPGAVLRIAGLFASMPSLALILGALVLVHRLLKAAERVDGLYTLDTARRVQVLGRFLTVGAATAGVIESAARTIVLTSQIHYPGINWFATDQWHLPLSSLLIGLCLITFARVMGIGVTMREELDVTV